MRAGVVLPLSYLAGSTPVVVAILPDLNDTHWTPDGHVLAADVIAKEIAPLLPPM